MIRDVALACGLMTGVAALSMEKLHMGGMEYWPMAARIMGDEWIIMNGTWRLVYGSVMVLPHAMMQATLLLMVSCVSRNGVLALISQLNPVMWLGRALYARTDINLSCRSATTPPSLPHSFRSLQPSYHSSSSTSRSPAFGLP